MSNSSSILITVENMINLAMGPEKENTVNFKLIHTILHVLAKQMRVLEQKIEIKADVYHTEHHHHHGERDEHDESDDYEKPTDVVDLGGKKVTAEPKVTKETTEKGKGKPDKSTKPKIAKKGRDKAVLAEDERDKEKVIVALRETKSTNAQQPASQTALLGDTRPFRSPSSDVHIPRVGSVEVVSRGEYMKLQQLVHSLKSLHAPIPSPTMPDNQQLRDNIATGQAKLTDTMEAMQVSARIDAAEQGIVKLVSLLTSLVSSGALPPDLQRKTQQLLQLDIKPLPPPLPSQFTAPMVFRSIEGDIGTKSSSAHDRHGDWVTRPQMDSAFQMLTTDLMKQLGKINKHSVILVSEALNHLHDLSARMEDAITLQELLEKVRAEMTLYYDQLNGFDDGFSSQLTNNEIQIMKMQTDLRNEVERIEAVSGNTETAAVRELTERYEGLVQELDAANFTNAQLHAYQNSLKDELKRLTDSVELLSEMKSDRVELLDNLSDKADKTQLCGLLKESVFRLSRRELEEAIAHCTNRFGDFDVTWRNVLNDLNRTIEEKASLFQLRYTENQFQENIDDINDKLNQLAAIIGEPSAAILTRKISRGGNCGVCLVPALMPVDIDYKMERPPVPGQEDIKWMPPPSDSRSHYCKRWCGGSHTIINANIRHAHANEINYDFEQLSPVAGLGDDGRLYLFENVREPCRECNVSLDGDGDAQK